MTLGDTVPGDTVPGDTVPDDGLVRPAYGGPCLDGVVPALLDRAAGTPAWMPSGVAAARQVVLLTLDGLGWDQLQARPDVAPMLAAMDGGPITTVAPSTTASALTSLTTGTPPARHGIVGYRMRVAGTDVLNVLRWKTVAGDARASFAPAALQPIAPFAGTKPPVVTRAEFADSGFTGAHLAGVRLHGWRMPSTLVETVHMLLADGEPFVYAYYDGVDKVAHEFGLGRMYDAELAAADGVVAAVADRLPAGAALVVVADHGHVDVGDNVTWLNPEVMRLTTLLSGEGRFRWLHARAGCRERLVEAAQTAYADTAWVLTRDEAVEQGWFGGALRPEVAARLGDIVLAARAPVAFLDPNDSGDVRMRSRHGSLTGAEMRVPLLAAVA